MPDTWSLLSVPTALETIATALAQAKKPLIVTSYLGRNKAAVDQLVKLVDLLGIPVFSSCLSTVNLPFDHVSHAGVSFGQHNPLVEEADVILIIDSDVPWCVLLPFVRQTPADAFFNRVPMHTKPSASAKIYHIDCDPLKERIAFHAFPSLIRARADGAIALEQIYDFLTSSSSSLLAPAEIISRRARLTSTKRATEASLAALEATPSDDILTAPFIVASLRRNSPAKTTVCNEAISNYPHVWNHFTPTRAGSMHSSGASSLGWALGAAIGVALAGKEEGAEAEDLVAVVVGDGSFLFGVPSTSYWIARRYETVRFFLSFFHSFPVVVLPWSSDGVRGRTRLTQLILSISLFSKQPFLTIVLNNGVRPHPSTPLPSSN